MVAYARYNSRDAAKVYRYKLKGFRDKFLKFCNKGICKLVDYTHAVVTYFHVLCSFKSMAVSVLYIQNVRFSKTQVCFVREILLVKCTIINLALCV